jgi:tetratricopeptide (TPR) repeat protein
MLEFGKNKDYRGAYEVLNEARTFYPTNTFFLSYEIYLLYRLNRIKEARQKAEEKLDDLKSDPYFLKNYLAILEKSKAKADIEQFINSDILYRDIKDEGLYIFTAKLAARILSLDKGLTILEKARERMPHSVEIKSLLAEWSKGGPQESGFKRYSEKFAGKKAENVIAEIEEIRTLSGYRDDFALHHYLADLYKKAGMQEKAIGIYRYLLSLHDDDFTRRMLGFAYKKAGDHDNAILCFKDALRKSPKDHYVYQALFKIFESRRDYEGFEHLIGEVLAANPDARHLYGILKKAKTAWTKD